MQRLDSRVIIPMYIKNLVSTIYILPFWFAVVWLYSLTLKSGIWIFPKDFIVFLLNSAGVVFLAALLVGYFYWAWITCEHFYYELQKDGLHIWQGVFLKTHMQIPYKEIVNVDILINPMTARFLDIYGLRITTHDKRYVIPGLTNETARFLRPELLRDAHIQVQKTGFFDPMSGHFR